MDNIPSELLKKGRRGNNNSPDSDMQEDLGDEGMAKGVDTVARHTCTKERQPRTVSELSYHQPSQRDHASSCLQRLKTKAEELLTEEQAGFRPGLRNC